MARVTAEFIEITYSLSDLLSSITLEHLVLWSCKCGKTKLNGEDRFNSTKIEQRYTIKNLPYAYSLCNISIYLKDSEAAYDNMWSGNATIENIKTGSKGK